MKTRLLLLLRILALITLALWWGGFTFYAARVVPIGNEVLHSKLRQGAITQRVTGELNNLALLVLALVALDSFASQPPRPALHWSGWIVTLAASIALFCLRAKLKAMFDPAARDIPNEPTFFHLHEIYLTIATVQWIAATMLLVSYASLVRRSESRGAADQGTAALSDS